jgi:uncharacterized protein Usg
MASNGKGKPKKGARKMAQISPKFPVSMYKFLKYYQISLDHPLRQSK